jgi:signal peptidase
MAPTRRRLSRLVRTATATLLGAVAVGLGLLLLVPIILGVKPLVVRSGSMEPYAPTGSLVWARQLEPTAVQVGDVILVRVQSVQASPPVLHRVIEMRRRGGTVVVTTQGDANAAPDPTPYRLTGRTMTPIAVLPYLGYVIGTAQSPVGWTVVVALPASLLLVVQLRSIWGRPEDAQSVGGAVGGEPAVVLSGTADVAA